jgi:hypothetical protein
MNHLPPQPGMWYVTFPHCPSSTALTLGGPFANEEDARRWLARASSLFLGGAVWQCPSGVSGPNPPRTIPPGGRLE